MAVWRKCRLYSTAGILGALFRVRADRLLVLRQDVSASVARLAVARTIQDFRDRAAREPAVLQPKLDEPSHQRVHARRMVSPSKRLSIR
jgi:hypothetical protein